LSRLSLRKAILPAIVVFVVIVFAGIFSQPANAVVDSSSHPNCVTTVLGMPVWYKYLEVDPVSCDVIATDGLLDGNIPWLISAAILEMLLRVATYAAVVMIFWGGFQIMTSSGNSESVGKGRDKILNGIYGFIIAMMAVSVVSYAVSSLTGDVGTTSQGLPDVTDGGTGAIEFALNLVYRLAAGITVIIITVSGFNFLISGGDPQRVNNARNGIIFAIVGLVITLMAFIIISSIGGRI